MSDRPYRPANPNLDLLRRCMWTMHWPLYWIRKSLLYFAIHKSPQSPYRRKWNPRQQPGIYRTALGKDPRPIAIFPPPRTISTITLSRCKRGQHPISWLVKQLINSFNNRTTADITNCRTHPPIRCKNNRILHTRRSKWIRWRTLTTVSFLSQTLPQTLEYPLPHHY